MNVTTHRPAVVIVDPDRANAIVSIAAGPFEDMSAAQAAYAALVDANDAAFDAGTGEFVWYQIRHIETVITIADADFADDSDASNDRPAEAMTGGTFGTRVAEFVAASKPAYVRIADAAADWLFAAGAAEEITIEDVTFKIVDTASGDQIKIKHNGVVTWVRWHRDETRSEMHDKIADRLEWWY